MDSASTNTKIEGLGETQQGLLLALKRLGQATQAQVARELPFAPATLREHLQSLVARGLVQRVGSRHAKPGRPEVVYALTDRADALFPSRAPELLRELVAYLIETGHSRELQGFFNRRVAARRPAALARVSGLSGQARVQEVARIFSEEGYMALTGADGAPALRLCHCPIRDVVSVTRLPCRYEEELMAELLQRPLRRTEYMPDGDPSCSYGDVADHPTALEST